MALKMRFLYYSGKAKMKAMAEVVKKEFDNPDLLSDEEISKILKEDIKVELDDEELGNFVEKTVADAIYT